MPPEIKPWTIKGVEPEVRNAALTAAERERMTMGDWIARAIREKIQADQGKPRVPAVVPQALPATPETQAEPVKPSLSVGDIMQAATGLGRIDDAAMRKQLSALLKGEIRAHRVAVGQIKPRAPRPSVAQPPVATAPAP